MIGQAADASHEYHVAGEQSTAARQLHQVAAGTRAVARDMYGLHTERADTKYLAVTQGLRRLAKSLIRLTQTRPKRRLAAIY